MDGARRAILFLLGVLCFIGAIVEDPVHLTSLFVSLLLMGVLTWDQIATTIRRNGHNDTRTTDDQRSP